MPPGMSPASVSGDSQGAYEEYFGMFEFEHAKINTGNKNDIQLRSWAFRKLRGTKITLFVEAAHAVL